MVVVVVVKVVTNRVSTLLLVQLFWCQLLQVLQVQQVLLLPELLLQRQPKLMG